MWTNFKIRIQQRYGQTAFYKNVIFDKSCLINALGEQAVVFVVLGQSYNLRLQYLLFHIHIPMPYLLHKTLMVCALIWGLCVGCPT